MSNAVTIVVDGNTVSTTTGVPGLSFASCFNHTLLELQSAASLSLSFTGISIAFIGGTRVSGTRNHTTFGISIRGDQGSFSIGYMANYPQNFSPQMGSQWYTSPQLPDTSGGYIVDMSNLELAAVDYVLIEAGTNTPLTGQTILVDDSNPEITWSGQWSNKTDFNIQEQAQLPNGNGTHSSTSLGSSFEFQFYGTSIIVAGVIDLDTDEDNFTVNFTIDGTKSTVRTFQHSNVLDSHVYHFVWFNDSSLTAAHHTLTANLTQVSGKAAFTVDYLIYNPSFDSLSNKPSFSPSTSTTTGTPTGTPTGTNIPPSPGTPVGAIAGGVVGGVIFLIILVAALWFCRRRRRGQVYLDDGPREIPTEHQPAFIVDPLIINPSYQPPPATKSLMLSSSTTQPTSDSSSDRQTTLHRHVEELAALEREMARQRGTLSVSNGPGASSSALVPAATQDQIADIQARIETLTKLMNEYVVPPAYESNQSSAGGNAVESRTVQGADVQSSSEVTQASNSKRRLPPPPGDAVQRRPKE